MPPVDRDRLSRDLDALILLCCFYPAVIAGQAWRALRRGWRLGTTGQAEAE